MIQLNTDLLQGEKKCVESAVLFLLSALFPSHQIPRLSTAKSSAKSTGSTASKLINWAKEKPFGPIRAS